MIFRVSTNKIYSILTRLDKKEWKMTLFAFTYANACTAMKGFDTDKNKKLEDDEREKLVNYIAVSSRPKLNYIIPHFQNISKNANVDEDFVKMMEASEIGKPDQAMIFHYKL